MFNTRWEYFIWIHSLFFFYFLFLFTFKTFLIILADSAAVRPSILSSLFYRDTIIITIVIIKKIIIILNRTSRRPSVVNSQSRQSIRYTSGARTMSSSSKSRGEGPGRWSRNVRSKKVSERACACVRSSFESRPPPKADLTVFRVKYGLMRSVKTRPRRRLT